MNRGFGVVVALALLAAGTTVRAREGHMPLGFMQAVRAEQH